MAAAATIPYLSVDEYLRTTYQPDADYVDGHIEERNLGEYDHSDLQGILVTIFRTHQKQWGLKALPELRLQTSATRFRVPDVTVLDVSKTRTAIIREAPMLCIEILSPEDRWSRVQLRVQEYLSMGVPEVWAVDAELRKVTVLRKNGMQSEHASEILKLPNTGAEIDLAEVFAVLDEG